MTSGKRSKSAAKSCFSSANREVGSSSSISRLYTASRKLTSSQAAGWIFGEASSPESTLADVLSDISVLKRKAKRMDKAAQLLLESNLHVVDISQMVGYKKPQYFIKLGSASA